MGQDDSPCKSYKAVEGLEELPSSPEAEIRILHLKLTQVSQFPYEKCKMLLGPFFNIIGKVKQNSRLLRNCSSEGQFHKRGAVTGRICASF